MSTRPLAALLARILLAYALVAQGVLGGAAMGLANGQGRAGEAARLGLCHGGQESAPGQREPGDAGHLPACCLGGCLPHALLPGAIAPAPLARRLQVATFAGPAPRILPPRVLPPFDATGPPPAA